MNTITQDLLGMIEEIKLKLNDNEYKNLIEKVGEVHKKDVSDGGYRVKITRFYSSIVQKLVKGDAYATDSDEDELEEILNSNRDDSFVFQTTIVRDFPFIYYFKNKCNRCKEDNCLFCRLDREKYIDKMNISEFCRDQFHKDIIQPSRDTHIVQTPMFHYDGRHRLQTRNIWTEDKLVSISFTKIDEEED